MPRVYTNYKNKNTGEQSLTWLFPIPARLPHSLVFVATEDPYRKDSSRERLVKLLCEYGDEVHQLLAELQLAPILYGQQSLEGAPTAYIMEYLSPPDDEKSGWVTLWQFFRSKSPVIRYSNAIEITLDKILTVMEKANVVHGGVRPNNIMLEARKVRDNTYAPVCSGEEQKANLRVIDFDWAGKSGSVCYPWERNEEIIWPAGPGKPIETGHDRALVEGWWRTEFSVGFKDHSMEE